MMNARDHCPERLSISKAINDVWRQLEQLDIEQAYPDRFECDTSKDVTTDGVHMNTLCDMLVAATWIKAMNACSRNR